ASNPVRTSSHTAAILGAEKDPDGAKSEHRVVSRHVPSTSRPARTFFERARRPVEQTVSVGGPNQRRKREARAVGPPRRHPEKVRTAAVTAAGRQVVRIARSNRGLLELCFC